jgi:hypothetical protein
VFGFAPGSSCVTPGKWLFTPLRKPYITELFFVSLLSRIAVTFMDDVTIVCVQLFNSLASLADELFSLIGRSGSGKTTVSANYP